MIWQISMMVSSKTPWVDRIGDHEGREVGGVEAGLGGEVGDVDVAIAVTFDGDHFHAGT